MSQCDVNTTVNSVAVDTSINTVDVDQGNNILVVPQEIISVVEVITPGPQGEKGEPGDPSLFTSSFVGTASFFAFTASYYLDSVSFSASIAELQDYSTSFDHSIIYTGSISAQVNVNNDLFLIKSGSTDLFNIESNANTTLYSNLFIVKNYTTQQPVLTVSQSIVQIATHSFDPTGTTNAGSIWFTSSSFYVGLE